MSDIEKTNHGNGLVPNGTGTKLKNIQTVRERFQISKNGN